MELVLPLLLAFGFLWLMTRRTRKMQKEAASFRENLAPGQEVMTGSGLFGTVVAVEADVITLETSPGVTSRWLRAAIAKVVEPPVVDDELEDDHDDETDRPVGTVPDDASSLTAEPRDPDDVDRR
ncbi:preprotein translocase subunit YajC [Actinotalea sp. Marseille-Q4924]|uniref:preprotein translocase subunit YajC n=1 Tax=Actinotalea sp. Marseille-Q4924 TaxID=2866571 RepID=UPI001CE446CA|nr:preprotein translocase subunit YajC [Actinotalea sp. Marseille-Q4924]